MQVPDVDDRYFPLVVNTIPTHMQAEHVPPFLAKNEALLKRRDPYVTITDLTFAKQLPSPIARKQLTDWSQANEPLMKRFTVGTAIAIDSALIRGGLTAIFWIAPPPYPQEVVASKLDGIEVVRRFWLAAGHPPNDCFDRYRAELAVLARRAAR